MQGLQPVAMHFTFHFPCSVLLIALQKLICIDQSIATAKLSYSIGVERYDIRTSGCLNPQCNMITIAAIQYITQDITL